MPFGGLTDAMPRLPRNIFAAQALAYDMSTADDAVLRSHGNAAPAAPMHRACWSSRAAESFSSGAEYGRRPAPVIARLRGEG